MRGQPHSLSNTHLLEAMLSHSMVPARDPRLPRSPVSPTRPLAPRGAHSYGLQGGGPRVTPGLLGNWGLCWPGPELLDGLTLPHCPRRWGLDGGPQQRTAHSRPHRTKGRASGSEDHFTERRSHWGVSAAQRSHGRSLSFLIIWTVTKEKRDS